MTRFVHRVLSESHDYIPEIIPLATSASASMLLRDPATWRRGARIRRESHNGVDVIHAGAWAAEVELFRYQPRRELTELLSHYDILQFVAGTAPWVATAADVDRPKCL